MKYYYYPIHLIKFHCRSIMADNASEGCFSLEEFEVSQIEEAAALPNVDNLTICKCCGHYLKEKGNFCSCRSLNDHPLNAKIFP